MKKLLLLSSLLLLLFAVACKNTKSSSKGDAAEKAAKPIEAKTATNGTPIEGQSGAGVTIGIDGGVNKDSLKSNPVRAIKHGSPDQMRLDSIKAAKAKGK